MNSPTLRKLGLLALTLAALAASRVSAIVLDFNVNGLGSYTPASQANNDAEVVIAANNLITWYNGGANPNGGPITYSLLPGSGVPAPALPGPAVFGFKDETAPFVDINPANYTYLLGKYGNVAYLFYLGNLAPGSYSLPATLGGNGLSHEVAFTAARTSVPDGGLTMALHGCTLLCLEGLRRRRSAA